VFFSGGLLAENYSIDRGDEGFMKKWMISMLAVVLVLCAVVVLVLFNRISMGKKMMAAMAGHAVPVTAIKVVPQTWVPEINTIGFIDPQNGVMLSTAESGEVSNILIKSGQKVQKGDLLVQLDVSKEEANLKSAQSMLSASKAERDRMVKLAHESMASKSQADTAVSNYQSLLAQIQSLKATIARREVRAPFSGYTGIVQVQLGQYLQAGTAVVRLEDIDTMKLRFTVGEKDYSKIAIDMPVNISVSAYPDRVFSGQISAIEPAVDTSTGVVNVEAKIPNSDGLLRTGMFAQAEIEQPVLQQQIVIPQSAIDFELYGESVFVLEHTPSKEKDQPGYDIAKQKTVIVKTRRGNLALISKGLEAGDRVVTSGQLKLYEGAKVKAVEDNTLAPPATLPLQ
jgi:membrane fusion protein, multidrug efflux system